jgi:hypothetical protein
LKLRAYVDYYAVFPTCIYIVNVITVYLYTSMAGVRHGYCVSFKFNYMRNESTFSYKNKEGELDSFMFGILLGPPKGLSPPSCGRV